MITDSFEQGHDICSWSSINFWPISLLQAVSGKKLFVVDYHDVFLPWVGRINAQAENRKQYASRSLFFLSSDCTLKVLAIELTLPPSPAGGGKISRVFTPAASSSAAPHSSSSSSSKKPDYLFELAKAHATNNDMTMQQSINHVWVYILDSLFLGPDLNSKSRSNPKPMKIPCGSHQTFFHSSFNELAFRRHMLIRPDLNPKSRLSKAKP